MPLNLSKKRIIRILLLINLGIYGASAYAQDSLKRTSDSTQHKAKEVKNSESGLKSKVIYSSRDSMRFNMETKKVYLFGQAEVKYEDLKLTAGYIELDMQNNLVYASGRIDSSGKEIEKPVFTQGAETFNSHEMNYNFKTKKGRISQVITKESDGYIHGETVKKDSTDIVYIDKGKYTTCELEHPHFYILASRLKVIPNDEIVTGPCVLVINDVITPLSLPFGFFPNKKGRKSGLIIPAYGSSVGQGFFMTNGGYYWGLSEYMDISILGDIYSLGSWGLKSHVNYAKKYKYTGSFDIKYSDFITGDPQLKLIPGMYTEQNSFLINWSHRQDPKADPGSTFSASVNAGSSSYNSLNSYNNPSVYLNNSMQSNISYSKTFDDNLFNLIIAARHSQNTETKEIDITLPQIDLTMNRIYPFKDKNSSIPRWYDKIGLSYTAEIANSVKTYDSLFMKPSMFKNLQNGFHQSIPISASFNAFKYFTITPSATYNSAVYYKTISEQYDSSLHRIDTTNIYKPMMENDFTFAVNLNTKIYGNYIFKKSSYVKQIRHLIIPNISYSWRPDFSDPQWGAYKTIKDTSSTLTYSKFQNSLYGPPPGGQSSLISWSVNNTVEAKVHDEKDSVNHSRKISIIDMFTIGSSYNAAASQFKMSNINLSGRTKLFKHLDVNFTGVINPYQIDAEGNPVDKLQFDKNGSIGRLTNYTIALSTSLKSKNYVNKTPANKAGTGATPPPKPSDGSGASMINGNPKYYADFNIPWSINLNYNFVFSNPGIGPVTETQSITCSGDVSMTAKWKIGYTSGYDFQVRQLTFTQFNIYRDLHCWEMKINWVPFGPRQSYSLNINVKAAALQDLKFTKKRDWYDYQ